MTARLTAVAVVWLLAAGASDSEAEARMFFVPQGGDPADYPVGATVVHTEAGESIVLELFVEAVAPESLRGVQIAVPRTQGGPLGSVEATWLGTNILRPDYVFGEFPASCEGVSIEQFIVFTCSTPNAVEVTESAYVGDIELRVSGKACGALSYSAAAPGSDTILASGEGEYIPFVADPAVFHVERYGDANYDGRVDIFDIFCALDGFQGVFSHCPMTNVDIGGCAADGRVDLFDIFAVLDAYGGVNGCPGWCGEPVRARLFLVREGDDPEGDPAGPTRVTIFAGESVSFVVYVENVASDLLRGAELELVTSVDGEAGSVVRTLAPGGVSYPGPFLVRRPAVPLGLVTYTASADAAGSFPIEFVVEAEEGAGHTWLFDGALRPIPFEPEGAVIVVEP